MNAKQIVLALVIVLLLVSAAAYVYRSDYTSPFGAPVKEQAPSAATTSVPIRVSATNKYIVENLSTLANLRSENGARPIVTRMNFSSATGTVEFTHGTSSYKAMFEYDMTGEGNVTITKFEVQK